MKKICTIVTVLLVICLVAGLSSGCGDSKLTKLRLNEVTHSIFYTPMYVAINEGLFEAEGLEIELTNGGGADKVMTAVLSGQAEIGFMGPEATVYVYNEGKEDYVINFCQLTKRDGSFLVAREADPDFSWDKVKGKTIIGGRKGGMPEMCLEYVLKQKGIIPNQDVEVQTNVQFDLMAGAFAGGTADYVALFEPVATTMEREGKGHVVAYIGEESGEVPYTVFSAKKSYIEQNPEIIQKFTNAIYRGQLWVQEHSAEEIVQAIKSSFPDTSDEELLAVVKRYRDNDAWAKSPIFTPEAFDRLQNILQEAGELSKKAPYDKLVTNEFAEKAIQEIKG